MYPDFHDYMLWDLALTRLQARQQLHGEPINQGPGHARQAMKKRTRQSFRIARKNATVGGSSNEIFRKNKMERRGQHRKRKSYRKD